MPFGDAAVDGLLFGILAGAVMALYLVLTSWLGSESPGSLLARFDPNRASPVIGAVFHFAVSGVYGIGFGLIWRLFNSPFRGFVLSLLLGLVFGTLLWLVAAYVLLPRANPALGDIAPFHFMVSHLLYGGALGLLMSRKGYELEVR
jgi:hypothetical protein